MTRMIKAYTQRELPAFGITGIPFIIDVDYNMLRHPKDPLNFIQFTDMMDKGMHYELRFDPKSETADLYGDRGNGLVMIKVPPMVQLDPEGVAKKYNLDVAELPKQDAQLRTHPDWFRQRKAGRQPTIRICGHTYFVNLNFGLLEPKNLFAGPISLFELKKDPANTHYTCLFHPKTQEALPYTGKDTPVPRDFVLVMIPHERILDPFARLRNSGFEDHPERLGAFPVRYDLEARVIPPEGFLGKQVSYKDKERLMEKKSKDKKKRWGL